MGLLILLAVLGDKDGLRGHHRDSRDYKHRDKVTDLPQVSSPTTSPSPEPHISEAVNNPANTSREP
jgi:hypothetical protein